MTKKDLIRSFDMGIVLGFCGGLLVAQIALVIFLLIL